MSLIICLLIILGIIAFSVTLGVFIGLKILNATMGDADMKKEGDEE